MSYLPASAAKDLVPPEGITAEPTPDGGVLMTATTDRLDPANREHLERSRSLAQLMIARTGYKRG